MDKENTVFRSLAIIEENIREKLTVEKLAESIHFSKYHYQRIFKEIVGHSVMRYVTRRRLALAAEELINTDNSILDIALKYGYDSHEGFSRSFKACMGISPKEYRKHRLMVGSPKIVYLKEKSAMLYSKTADEIICELNKLIVQSKETAEYLRKNKNSDPDTVRFYSDFWEHISAKTDALADTLSGVLKRITDDENRPDEITARFILIKTVEDAIIQLNLINFQTGLTVSRALPEHISALAPKRDKISELTHNAVIKSTKIVELFNEQTKLIFEDMRNTAKDKLEKAAQRCREVITALKGSPNSCYDYIREEIEVIEREISHTSLEKITTEFLEDLVFRLDIIAFSAEIDVLRNPSDKALFDGIADIKAQLLETAEFFGTLSDDIIASFEEGKDRLPAKVGARKHGDDAFKENILLFYMKGEYQKLEPHLSDEQKAAFDKIIKKMNTVIILANLSDCVSNDILQPEMNEGIKEVYLGLTALKENLGVYGAAVGYIAEELKYCGIYRCIMDGEENSWL